MSVSSSHLRVQSFSQMLFHHFGTFLSPQMRRRQAHSSSKRNCLEKETLNQKLHTTQDSVFCVFACEGISIVFPLEMRLKTGKFNSTILYTQYLGEYSIFLSSVFSVGKVRFTRVVFVATKIYKCLCCLVPSTKPNSDLGVRSLF